jgi:1-acyl-sn-glycerol-3-phosphate acyltransferase
MPIRSTGRNLVRRFLRITGRLVLPIFFRIDLRGLENIPRKGPLLLIGNHNAVMEVALMVIYTSRNIEFLGSTDVPHEPLTNFFAKLYGFIPYKRGHFDRPALRQSLEVLSQGGCLVLFPEGGIWQIAERRVQSGVAWLSAKSHAPVQPIYFGGTAGALTAALHLKRPRLLMKAGKIIPAAAQSEDQNHKEYFRIYSIRVMDEVEKLRPANEKVNLQKIRDETFSLETVVMDGDFKLTCIPDEIQIIHTAALAKFLHYPTILKIFKVNFHMPIDALQQLSSKPSSQAMAESCKLILDFLRDENPYLLTYRFGQEEGEAMRLGLLELESLARWTSRNDYTIQLTPIRKYFDIELGKEVVQIEQGEFKNWM